MRVGIVGMGWVGASVAISTLQSGITTELLIHDIKQALAEGEALDLGHGASFYPTCAVRPAALDESGIVVVSQCRRRGAASLDRVAACSVVTAVSVLKALWTTKGKIANRG